MSVVTAPSSEQQFVWYHLSWDQYEDLLRVFGDRRLRQSSNTAFHAFPSLFARDVARFPPHPKIVLTPSINLRTRSRTETLDKLNRPMYNVGIRLLHERRHHGHQLEPADRAQ